MHVQNGTPAADGLECKDSHRFSDEDGDLDLRSRAMQGAFVCMWGGARHELIEFLPARYRMISTPQGAGFEDVGARSPCDGVHVQLEDYHK